MWPRFKAWLAASWKAIIALLAPIAFGAAAEMLDALGEWVTTQNGIWVGIVYGVIQSIAVWLKSNSPNPS